MTSSYSQLILAHSHLHVSRAARVLGRMQQAAAQVGLAARAAAVVRAAKPEIRDRRLAPEAAYYGRISDMFQR